jgi:hypothetical protein
MKFKILVVVMLAIATIAFMGCEKDGAITPITENNETIVEIQKAKSNNNNLRELKKDDEGQYYCKGNNGNCLPDVVVNGKALSIEHLFAIIEQGDKIIIADFFKNNFSALTEYIPKELIEGIINGKLLVELKNSTKESTKMMLFKTEKKEIVNAIPFVNLQKTH